MKLHSIKIENLNIEAFKKDMLKELQYNPSPALFIDLEEMLEPVFKIVSD